MPVRLRRGDVADVARLRGGWAALLGVALIAACTSAPAPVAPVRPAAPVVEAPLDPPCSAAGTVTLPPSNHLRCRELPIDVAWPAGTKLTRVDSSSTTVFSANLDRGLMLVIVEPAFEPPTPEHFGKLLQGLVGSLVADAKTTPHAPPPLPGATVTAGFTFTTPDGGAGVIRGYVAHNWIVAIASGGRLAETPARPEHPVGKAFLDSLSLHEPRATPPLRLDLGKRARLDLPATAWPMKELVDTREPIVRNMWGFVIPAQRVGLTVRDLERGEHCTRLSATPDAGVAAWLKSLFTGGTFEVHTAARAKFGDAAAYAEVEQEGRKMALVLVCHDASFVQLSVFGTRPHGELRAVLEPIAKSFVGAPANQAP